MTRTEVRRYPRGAELESAPDFFISPFESYGMSDHPSRLEVIGKATGLMAAAEIARDIGRVSEDAPPLLLAIAT